MIDNAVLTLILEILGGIVVQTHFHLSGDQRSDIGGTDAFGIDRILASLIQPLEVALSIDLIVDTFNTDSVLGSNLGSANVVVVLQDAS